MSRSGYTDDFDDPLDLGRWRGAVKRALRGKRGQAFLKEMLAALDAMPVKRLVADDLAAPDLVPCSHWGLFESESVCAIGSVGKARGIDMSNMDPDDCDSVANTFGIATCMAQEIVFENDEAGPYLETPERRYQRIRRWIVSEIREPDTGAKA